MGLVAVAAFTRRRKLCCCTMLLHWHGCWFLVAGWCQERMACAWMLQGRLNFSHHGVWDCVNAHVAVAGCAQLLAVRLQHASK